MDEYMTVTLTLDNDEVVECAVLTIFSANGQDYIALLPLDENGDANENGDVFLYRYEEIDGEPNLSNIEDDDEYERPLMHLMSGLMSRNLTSFLTRTSK